MDKSEFNPWKGAFEDAEISPPRVVWDKIDAVLANKESGNFKKRILFFQLLAAASVSLAIGFGIYTVNTSNTRSLENPLVSDAETTEKAIEQNPKTEDELLSSKDNTSIAVIEDEKINVDNNSHASALLKDNTSTQNQRVQNSPIASSNESTLIEQDTYQMSAAVKKGLDWPLLETINIDVHKVHYGFIESVEEEMEATKYPLMAGLNMGTSTVNSEPGSNFSDAMAARDYTAGLNSPQQTNTESNAVSYSIGINVGKQIAPRWIIQSGLQYAVQSADATSNVFYEDAINKTKTPIFNSETASFIGASEDFNVNNLGYTSTIDLTNSFELLTIPVQIGYLIVDKKLTWMVSSGIATDIFLKNKVTSNTAGFEDVVVKPGSDSPFRTTHFSGLISTELGYKLGEHYNLSIEPRFKVALQSFTKENQSIERRPNSLGIGIKFRYVFDN